jgi:indoleamine 2,3-dioxygenase
VGAALMSYMPKAPMGPMNFTLPNFSDYDISPEQGFLPPDPLGDLPDSPTLNDLGHELPKLLSARTVRRFIDEQRQLLPSIPSTWRTEDYRAVMRILSFCGHA